MAPPNFSEKRASKPSSHLASTASALEQDIWLLDKSGIPAASLNLYCLLQNDASFNAGALARAFGKLFISVPSLRSKFYMREGGVYSECCEVAPSPTIDKIHLSGAPAEQVYGDNEVNQRNDRIAFDEKLKTTFATLPNQIQDYLALPFDLSEGPLLRVSLVFQNDSNSQCGGDDGASRLLVVLHPICCIENRLRDIVEQLLTYYQKECESQLDIRQDADQSNRDRHVSAQGDSKQIEEADGVGTDETGENDPALEDRWRSHLNGFSGYLPLVDYAQSLRSQIWQTQSKEQARAQLQVTLAEPLSAALVQWSSRHCYSTDLLVFVVIKIALSRLLDESKIIIGRRLSLDPARVYGNKVLPVATSIDDSQTLAQCLNAERAAIDFVEQNAAITMGRLTRFAGERHKVGEAPIYQLDYCYSSNVDGATLAESMPLGVRVLACAEQARSTPLSLHVAVTDSLSWSFDYDNAQISGEFLAIFSSALQALLQSIVRFPDVHDVELSQLAIAHLSPEALAFAKHCQTIETATLLLPQRIERSLAQRSAERVAQFEQGHDLSGERLEREASQLAAELVARGCKRNQVVALALPRNDELLIALYAMLKLGVTYLPLDLSYPVARLQHMLKDSGAKIVITEEVANFTATYIDDVEADGEDVPSLSIDRDSSTDVDLRADIDVLAFEALRSSYADRDEQLASRAQAEDIAYVIYTSGSTGKPKGVQIPHSALANFLQAMCDKPGLTPSDRLLAITTLSFDISVLELFLPLLTGADLVVADSRCASDGRRLQALIEEFDINVLQATPSAWRLLLAAGFNGGAGFTALSGGEALSQDLAFELKNNVGRLFNMYGPTETTVWSSVCEVVDAQQEVQLGLPIANTFFVVLNQKRMLLPRGAIGELYIGGAGLARGYLNRPTLTQQRFVSDYPLAGNKEGDSFRLYRTGDRVYQLSNGSLVGIGRLDNQVKLRGHRIELGEVEEALQANSAVDQAVAVVSKLSAQDQRLILFYRASKGEVLTNTEVRKFLSKRLPNFMLPQLTVAIPRFPLMPNGKVDRQALLDHLAVAPAAQAGRKPQSDAQRALAVIWSEVLETSEINLDDRFFDIGGHSLIAMQLLQKIEQDYCQALTFSDLLENSFEQIAAKLALDAGMANSALQQTSLPSPPPGLLRRLLGVFRKQHRD